MLLLFIYLGVEGEESTLRTSVWKSLKQTEELQLRSISIPAISSGIFNFPKELCAEVFILFYFFFSNINYYLHMIQQIHRFSFKQH